MIKIKILKIFLLALLLVVAGGIFAPRHADAITGIPFGGKVLFARYCSCSGNFHLTFSGPFGGALLYHVGTQAYQSFNLGYQTGIWALGLYTPGGICLVDSCEYGPPAIGTIQPTVGTSPLF